MTGGALFACGPGYETLAAELAELVQGSWERAPGVHDVMIMPNGARVPVELPGQPSDAAVAWWHRSVATNLGRTNAEW
jgi:hypothetical protein